MPRARLGTKDACRRALARELDAYRALVDPTPTQTARMRAVTYGMHLLSNMISETMPSSSAGESDLLKWLSANEPDVRKRYVTAVQAKMRDQLKTTNVRNFPKGLSTNAG